MDSSQEGEFMKKILLITPDFTPEETRVRSIAGGLSALKFMPQKTLMAPLGLATVAALTPDDIDVDIWDEAVHGLIADDTDFGKDYDLVGVTGYINHLLRVKRLGELFRRRGIPVAVGGPGVSSAPEHYRHAFDILFIGEAEYTWPQFITEWKAGHYRSEYRQVEKLDMTHSPLPRWDKVAADLKQYVCGGVQTTRGCPFDCEFCDVIYIYGRQARHKSIEQVLQEVSALERLGVERIFFSDDNFIGNPHYAKALLKALIPVNNAFRNPIGFFTQITLNVAKDDEMLELLADANFSVLFIGIESANIDSLIEINKPQNYKTDMVGDIKKILSYGLPVTAGLIVGFDHDDASIFDQQFEFSQEACIPMPTAHMLKAPLGTKLWVRFHKEGRVVHFEETGLRPLNDTRAWTNILPKLMTRQELMTGYLSLVERLRDWRNFETRVMGMLSLIQRQPQVKPRTCVLGTKHGGVQVRPRRHGAASATMCHPAPALHPPTSPLHDGQGHRAVGPAVSRSSRGTIVARVDRQPKFAWRVQRRARLQREPTVFFVPEAFKKPYRDLFPQLHERVHQGLIDKSRTQDALVEVVYDFLTRWGLTFEQFEEHHRAFLFEICDRTIAKENGELPAGDGCSAGTPGASRSPRRSE